MKPNTLQKNLSLLKVKPLTQKEQDLTWDHIRFGMTRSKKQSKKTPFAFLRKSIAVTLIFGLTAGTAFAADNAKPGDVLFPIDRALENIQLSFASDADKDALQVKFALERVTEVKDILAEVVVQQTATSIKIAEEQKRQEDIPSANNADTSKAQEENLPAKTLENTPKEAASATTKEDSADSTSDTSLEQTQEVNDTTDPDAFVHVEETSSTSDKTILPLTSLSNNLLKDISVGDKKRIELALGTALSFLGDVKGELAEQGNLDAVEYIDVMLSQLNKDIGTLPGEVTFEVYISAKKERVTFEVTSSENNKQSVNIEVKQSLQTATGTPEQETAQEAPKVKQKPTESKLEIKDGEIKITTPSKESVPNIQADKASTTPAATTGSTTKYNAEDKAASTTTETFINDTQNASTTGTSSPNSEILKDPYKPEDDGTTSVKLIFKKLDDDFELSVTDQNAAIHSIVNEYIEENPQKGTDAS